MSPNDASREVVLDKTSKEKQSIEVDDILEKFNKSVLNVGNYKAL